MSDQQQSPSLQTPPPRLPPKKMVPANLKPSTSKQPPPPLQYNNNNPASVSPVPASSLQNNTNASFGRTNSTNTTASSTASQARRSGRFLHLSANNVTNNTNNNNNTSSSTTTTTGDAVVASLLSKDGAFSETFRLDRSRKPVCNFKPIDMNRWLPDSVTSVCMSPVCEVPFTLFTRRHHCRSCGLVYCSSCLKHTLNENTSNNSTAGTPPQQIAHRVCAVCFFIHQLAITQQAGKGQQQSQQQSSSTSISTKNTIAKNNTLHHGAHPFNECLIRSDLVKQVRYVSTDGGTTYRQSSKNKEQRSSTPVATGTKTQQQKQEQEQQSSKSTSSKDGTKTPPLKDTRNIHDVSPRLVPSANNSGNNNFGDKTPPPTPLSSTSHQDDLKEQEIKAAIKAIMPKTTYVSYWSTEERLNAMQRRGRLRAFPWSIIVAIAEYLPLRDMNKDGNKNNNEFEETTSPASVKTEDDSGLFSFSLVCSDFYFAARTNSIWTRFLWMMRNYGTWIKNIHQFQNANNNSHPNSESMSNINSATTSGVFHYQQDPACCPPPEDHKQQSNNNNNNNNINRFPRENTTTSSNLSVVLSKSKPADETYNQQQQRTFSLNSFESDHQDFGPADGESDNINNNNFGNNNNNNVSSGANSSSSPGQQQNNSQQQVNSSVFSPPFSVFAEFVTEAASHRSNQLSSSGARVHKLFANGIRITFAGDEENLKTNLVRGFAFGDIATNLPQSNKNSSENRIDEDFVNGEQNRNNSSIAGVMSPTTPSMLGNNNNNASFQQQSNNNNNNNSSTSSVFASTIPAALLTNTLGFLTYNQVVHVALAANQQQQQQEAQQLQNKQQHQRKPSAEVSGVRQSFVRIYNVKSGRRHWQITRLAAKSSHACVVCYDATSRDSLTNAALYFTEVVATSVNPRTTLRVLCGIIPNRRNNNNNTNVSFDSSNISPETALAFVGCSSSSSVVSVTVSADDPVGAVEKIVQAVFYRTLKGEQHRGSRRSGLGDGRSVSENINNNEQQHQDNADQNNLLLKDESVLQVPTVLDILCSDGADVIP